MAALRKANVLFFYDNQKDCFTFYDAYNSLMFSCTFDQIKNRWCIPYPFIRSDGLFACVSLPPVFSSYPSACNSAPVMPIDPFITPFERIYPSSWSPQHLTKAEKVFNFGIGSSGMQACAKLGLWSRDSSESGCRHCFLKGKSIALYAQSRKAPV
jgi:hypothetical protein